jgi:hypothetical protein
MQESNSNAEPTLDEAIDLNFDFGDETMTADYEAVDAD